MDKKIEVIPTVMPNDKDDFIEKINRVAKFVKTIQIDVMDGKFVPSKSWPYNSLPDNYWNELMAQNEGLPEWDSVDFEIDLMVSDQLQEALNWINAGVGRIIGHIEAFQNIQQIQDFIDLGKSRGLEVCLALAPSTDNSVLDPWLDHIDGVQFMGIEKVGFQGQPFAENILGKISDLRNKMPDLPISVDGGVSDETAEKLVQAGATRLSSGSYIFNATNPKEAIENLSISYKNLL